MGDRLAGIKIPDIVKFGIMMLVYTFYMAWWASRITANDEYMLATMDSHIEADGIVTINVLKNTQAIEAVIKLQERLVNQHRGIFEEHADCKAMIKLVNERIQRLENGKINQR